MENDVTKKLQEELNAAWNNTVNYYNLEMWKEYGWRLMQESKSIKEENKKLREALDFYAEKINYVNEPWSSQIQKDEGAIAREALERKDNL